MYASGCVSGSWPVTSVRGTGPVARRAGCSGISSAGPGVCSLGCLPRPRSLRPYRVLGTRAARAGPGGWACATSAARWRAGGHQATTNNLMELRAVFEAVQSTPADRAVVIETDSRRGRERDLIGCNPSPGRSTRQRSTSCRAPWTGSIGTRSSCAGTLGRPFSSSSRSRVRGCSWQA